MLRLYADILTSPAEYFIFEPLNPSDIADEEVSADAADVGDEEAAVGDRVDVRHHIVAQVLIPVAPLATAKTVLEYQWDQEHLWTQLYELGYLNRHNLACEG